MNELKLNTPTNFVNVLGSNPNNRILDFFIENNRTSWALTEVASHSRVAYPSVKLIVPRLLDKQIIKIDKKVGRIKFYTINTDNPISRKLGELRKIINRFEIENYLK